MNRTTPKPHPNDLTEPFPAPDYEDHFVLDPGTPCTDIDAFVERLALRQPRWLTGVSMGITSRPKLEEAVASVLAGTGIAIGNWAIVDRTDTSITFAEDMRIMRYRISYSVDSNGEVAARTEVEQQSRWLGRIYWALVVPMHKRFVQRMLRNAGGTGSTTREISTTGAAQRGANDSSTNASGS